MIEYLVADDLLTRANRLPHLALSVTSPYTLATCRARARIENIRLGTWAL